MSETAVAELVVSRPEEELLDAIAQLAAKPIDIVRAGYQSCVAEMRIQLLAERGDPTPHRLA